LRVNVRVRVRVRVCVCVCVCRGRWSGRKRKLCNATLLPSLLQSFAARHIATHCNTRQHTATHGESASCATQQCRPVCCSLLLLVAVWCSLLQSRTHMSESCRVSLGPAVCCSLLPSVAVWDTHEWVMSSVTRSCSLLQSVAARKKWWQQNGKKIQKGNQMGKASDFYKRGGEGGVGWFTFKKIQGSAGGWGGEVSSFFVWQEINRMRRDCHRKGFILTDRVLTTHTVCVAV